MPQLGGKSFTDRSTSGTPILQRSDTGTVNWTTGWVSTDGTTTVADGAKLTFNHNLGTTNITVDVYVCDNASGTGEVNKIEEVFFQNQAGAFVSHGCQVQDITNEQLTVSLSYYGYAHWSDAGTAGSVDASTTRGFGASNGPDNKQKYIKVVATAGTGSSGGNYSGLGFAKTNPATTSPRKGARVKGLQILNHSSIRTDTSYGIAQSCTVKLPHNGWTICVPEGNSDWSSQHTHWLDINPDTGVADPGVGYNTAQNDATGTNNIICGDNHDYNFSGYFISHGEYLAAGGDMPDAYLFNLTAKASFNVDNTRASAYSGVMAGAGVGHDKANTATWTTVDLSPIVGARRCLVRLFVGLAGAREGTWTNDNVGSTYVQLRTKGDTLVHYPGTLWTGWGCGGTLVGNGSDDAYMWGGYALVMTDDQGRIEALQGGNTSGTSFNLGLWTCGHVAVTYENNTVIQNAALGSSYVYSGSLQYVGQNVGGGTGSDGLMAFKRISTGKPNSLVYIRATSTSSGVYIFARTPNDPINWYNGTTYSHCGMSATYARSSNGEGGYIAVLTDGQGDIEVQTDTNSHVKFELMCSLAADVIY